MSLYLPTGNEVRIIQAYANRDPRLAANVITPYSTYLGVFSGANATVTSKWPYRSEVAVNGDLRTDTQSFFITCTGNMFTKDQLKHQEETTNQLILY
jgi:hypothetical protein